MEKMLDKQVAIVAGGTSGMGEAVARLYAREGADVIIGSRNTKKGTKLAEEINAEGGSARYYGPMDITKEEDIDGIVNRTLDEFGKIDILAVFSGKTFDAAGLSPEECHRKTMEVNMDGTYNLVFKVVPHMKERKSGKIIICSSNGAFNPTTPAYSHHMAKAACESLTVNLAMECAPLGIRVNCIKPGPIVTPFWDELDADGTKREALFEGISRTEVPLGRMGTPEDVAGPALFFASDLSSYITGLCLYVAGGMGYVYAHGQSYILKNLPID